MKPKKKIVFDSCLDCPITHNCACWRDLSPKVKALFVLGVNVEVGILNDCALEDEIKHSFEGDAEESHCEIENAVYGDNMALVGSNRDLISGQRYKVTVELKEPK